MNRKIIKEGIKRLIEKIRRSFDEVVIRIIVLVGFFIEIDEEFEEFCSFLRWVEFDRFGVFMYF